MKIKSIINRFTQSIVGATIVNILLAFLLLFIARIIFVVYNYDRYSGYMTVDLAIGMIKGGATFDVATLAYVNALYLLLMLFPFHLKERNWYHQMSKYVFIVFNSLALLMNIVDTVYFRFTARRTTTTVFNEFKNETNLTKIFFTEFFHNFVLVLIFAFLVFLLIKLYRQPKFKEKINLLSYYITTVIALTVATLLSVASIRGGVDRTTRPITISNANQYVNRPIEAAAVLNTPFSIIRTIGKTAYENPGYFPASMDLSKIYSPVHYPNTNKEFKKKNVVIFILESMSRGFIGALNRDLDNGKFEGYTPFLDSLIQKSLTYRYSFANGMKSIDAMPSVLCGIPMMVEPFVLTPASMNELSGLGGELKRSGYHTAFFHGAPNGSMGLQAFGRSCGFQDYYGLDEYKKDSNFGGMNDFDGAWAIWDYPFFQFYEENISEMKEPFVTALFSATSHHPFKIPAEYKTKFPEKSEPLYKCISYTDEGLRAFFEKAKKEKWFNNTIFVITADHSGYSNKERDLTDQGVYAAPIIFYAPADTTLRGFKYEIAQQIDIMPTILSYLGYDKPFVSFGNNLLTTPAEKRFAVSYLSGIYQYTKGDYFLQFDGKKSIAIYNYKKDQTLKHNLINSISPDIIRSLETELKAFIQQYMVRMNSDNLTIKK
ncbi:MAG: sulfatase-like hydrolase/transferase [Muribaculaceae bacterium]